VPGTVLTLRAQDWARTRFARSLLWETTQAVRTLIHSRRPVHDQRWLALLDSGTARHHLPVLTALNPTSGWIPDFLAPPPASADRSFADELAEVAVYPTATVATDLLRSLQSRQSQSRRAVLEPLIAEPDVALVQILTELDWAWRVLLAPFWSQVHELIEADIAYRSRDTARLGLGQALAELHPDVRWHDGTITVDHTDGVTVDLRGQGLTLMPSAYVWPDVIVVLDAPWPPTLVFPARGVGELWSAPPAAPNGLARVLGPTRALLLADLAHPSTTTKLAARLQLSPAAVSTQLGRLRDAGLVSSRRLGKEVLYRRTALAEHLLRASA
jgi:DNA-binding transcriptional ArsR family regulator